MVKRYTLLLICLVASLGGTAQSFAPEVWASAGGYHADSKGSVAWTLGETVIETATRASSNLTITQGFHQPSISISTSTTQAPQDISPVFTVFPNPTSGIVRIKLSKPMDKPVQVSLFNTLGQLIQSDLWHPEGGAAEMELSLENLANGVYFLQITMGGESIGVYKVQKDRN